MLDSALDVARQIADALSVAHDTGVVHRDIKSSNILITERGQAKILDFGLATFYGATQVTDAGSTMGTAAYMSPEQTQGRPIDHRSDLFSFGVVLYEMITGRRPFDGDNRNTIAYAICNQDPEPMARYKTGVPQAVEGIVNKALRKDPTERYQSAADMMADIKVAARESDRTAVQPPQPPTPSQPYYVGQPQTPYTPGTPQTPVYPQTPHTPGTAVPPQTPMHPQQPPSASQPPQAAYAAHTPSQPMPPYAPPAKPKSNLVVIVSIIVGGLIAITAILAPRLGNRSQTESTAVVNEAANKPPQVHTAVQTSDDRTKIAVLPFDNQGTTEDEYFADGITEEITARLAAVRDLGVIARTSVTEYKGSKKAASDIGKELGVDYVLEGTVRWQRGDGAVNRVRVTPQLIRVADGTSVWADVYDEPMTAVFKVQSNIAKTVVQRLGVAILEPEQQALDVAPTENMEAYDAYLKGMRLKDLWNSAQDMRVAANQFEKATSLDPEFLMAYVRLAEVNADMVWFVHDASEFRVEAARRAAQRAVELAPESPDAQWAMGWYYYHAERDLENAMRYLEPVLEQRPNSADAHAAVAFVQRRLGRFDEAIDNLLQAVELSPNSHVLWSSIGETYTFTRQYAKARPYFERSIEVRPEFAHPRIVKVLGYVGEGDLLSARREARALIDVFGADEHGPRLCYVEFLLRDYESYFDVSKQSGPLGDNASYWPAVLCDAIVHRAMGNESAARAAFTRARDDLAARVEREPNDFRYHGSLGIAYAGLAMEEESLMHADRAIALLPPASDAMRSSNRRWELALTMLLLGDHDAAIDQLEILITTPSWISESVLRKHPTLDPLRENPRFKALLGNT
jgi:serine/threonine-protein kinase